MWMTTPCWICWTPWCASRRWSPIGRRGGPGFRCWRHPASSPRTNSLPLVKQPKCGQHMLAVFLDRLGRHEAAATIAGFAFSPLTAAAFPRSTRDRPPPRCPRHQTYECSPARARRRPPPPWRRMHTTKSTRPEQNSNNRLIPRPTRKVDPNGRNRRCNRAECQGRGSICHK